MASQVLSGTSNPSYTNNTGENVRVVINFMQGFFKVEPPSNQGGTSSTITLNWAGISVSNVLRNETLTIGRNLAISRLTRDTNETSLAGAPLNVSAINSVITTTALAAVGNNASGNGGVSLPTELMLAPGQTFSAVCGIHNIVVIPENG